MDYVNVSKVLHMCAFISVFSQLAGVMQCFVWIASSVYVVSPCQCPDSTQCLGTARPGLSVHAAALAHQHWSDY